VFAVGRQLLTISQLNFSSLRCSSTQHGQICLFVHIIFLVVYFSYLLFPFQPLSYHVFIFHNCKIARVYSSGHMLLTGTKINDLHWQWIDLQRLLRAGPSRGEKGGKFSRAPQHLGGRGPCQHSKILKRVFQMSSFWLQICVKSIFCPGPHWGSLRCSLIPLVGWWVDTPPHVSSILDASILVHTEWGCEGPAITISRAPLGLSSGLLCALLHYTHLSEPTTKIWMRIDPDYQRQKCSPEILLLSKITLLQGFSR